MRWESRRGTRHPLQTEFTSDRVVIVGTGEWGAIALEYFSYDSPHEVVAFSAEAPFITTDVYCGLPVVPFEELAQAYPPSEYRAFVAVSDIQLNRVRRRLYQAVKALGFTCVSYVSSHAFALPNAEIGENTFVHENAALEFMVRLGNNVLIGAGTCIGHSSVIEDDCYAGPHVTVCGYSTVGRASFLGASCCIADGVSVAEDCVIGAGAVVLKDTKPRQVYVGSPARPTGRDSFAVCGVASGLADATAVRRPGV
jgi:sugar O-acyltransferase (sialic acid O-acetyltransferase NeuD family)